MRRGIGKSFEVNRQITIAIQAAIIYSIDINAGMMSASQLSIARWNNMETKWTYMPHG